MALQRFNSPIIDDGLLVFVKSPVIDISFVCVC